MVTVGVAGCRSGCTSRQLSKPCAQATSTQPSARWRPAARPARGQQELPIWQVRPLCCARSIGCWQTHGTGFAARRSHTYPPPSLRLSLTGWPPLETTAAAMPTIAQLGRELSKLKVGRRRRGCPTPAALRPPELLGALQASTTCAVARLQRAGVRCCTAAARPERWLAADALALSARAAAAAASRCSSACLQPHLPWWPGSSSSRRSLHPMATTTAGGRRALACRQVCGTALDAGAAAGPPHELAPQLQDCGE